MKVIDLNILLNICFTNMSANNYISIKEEKNGYTIDMRDADTNEILGKTLRAKMKTEAFEIACDLMDRIQDEG